MGNPGFRANASIGRAIRLMRLNLGGGIPGVGSATVFSTPMRCTACLKAKVDKSRWETLAVSRGDGEDANVITCAVVESPRLCYDDPGQTPERLLVGIADSIAGSSSWNTHVRPDMLVATSLRQATIGARAGISRADVHAELVRIARDVRELKRGGHRRAKRAAKLDLDPADDGRFVPELKDARDLHRIVPGGCPPDRGLSRLGRRQPRCARHLRGPSAAQSVHREESPKRHDLRASMRTAAVQTRCETEGDPP